MNLLDATEVFMTKAGQLDPPPAATTWPIGDHTTIVRELRRKLLREEFKEYSDAEDADDLIEVTDGLLDIIVVAWGALLAYHGPDKAKAAAAEVARSNLDKVIGEGLPIFRPDGKVLKPEGWRPPDIAAALAAS